MTIVNEGIEVIGAATFDGTTLNLANIGNYPIGDLTVTIKAWLSTV